MKFAAAGSQEQDLGSAIRSACQQVRTELGNAERDLTCVFVSHHHQVHFDGVAQLIQEQLSSKVLLGATAETIICNDREWETGPALSLWSASLPEYQFLDFHVEFESTPDGVISLGIPDALAEEASRLRACLVFGEPYSSAPHAFIERLAADCPGVPLVGGMASGARNPGENRLFWNNRACEEGMVAVALLDGPPLRTLVSQGCRPVGEPYVVTKAERNIILEMGGHTALSRVQEVYEAASASDRQLLEEGLLVGVAMSEYRDSFQQGDFLVSNVLGADRQSGAIATGQSVRKGQTVQFHIRDAASADHDLRQLIERTRSRGLGQCAGGLLFSCNGRGSRMFPEPHHDAAALQQGLGPFALAGMFAAGEIGPVGPNTYLHGYTASALLFPQRELL